MSNTIKKVKLTATVKQTTITHSPIPINTAILTVLSSVFTTKGRNSHASVGLKL